MTPQEEAERILGLFLAVKVYDSRPIDLSWSQAVKCALIHVDGLMRQAMEIESQYSLGIVDNEIRFLEQVKNEIKIITIC